MSAHSTDREIAAELPTSHPQPQNPIPIDTHRHCSPAKTSPSPRVLLNWDFEIMCSTSSQFQPSCGEQHFGFYPNENRVHQSQYRYQFKLPKKFFRFNPVSYYNTYISFNCKIQMLSPSPRTVLLVLDTSSSRSAFGF